MLFEITSSTVFSLENSTFHKSFLCFAVALRTTVDIREAPRYRVCLGNLVNSFPIGFPSRARAPGRKHLTALSLARNLNFRLCALVIHRAPSGYITLPPLLYTVLAAGVPRPRFYVLRVPDGSKSSEGSRDGRWKSLCERGSLTGEDFRSLLYTLHTSSPSATLLPLARSRK